MSENKFRFAIGCTCVIELGSGLPVKDKRHVNGGPISLSRSNHLLYYVVARKQGFELRELKILVLVYKS